MLLDFAVRKACVRVGVNAAFGPPHFAPQGIMAPAYCASRCVLAVTSVDLEGRSERRSSKSLSGIPAVGESPPASTGKRSRLPHTPCGQVYRHNGTATHVVVR